MDQADDELLIKEIIDEMYGPDPPSSLRWKPDRIKGFRKDRGWSQTELGTKCGLTQSAISNLENGNPIGFKGKGRSSKVSMDSSPETVTTNIVVLYALATVLKCDLEDIAFLPKAMLAEITPEQIRKLEPQLLEIENVYTLSGRRRLRDIYYRTVLIDMTLPRAIFDNPDRAESHEFAANTIDDVPKMAVVVLGTAGQGKSIFLRHLAIQEVIEARKLPVFVQLRSLKSDAIEEQILTTLQGLGVCQNSYQLSRIFRQDQVVLFFDAFDELAIHLRQDFLFELSRLHRTYPKLRIVITSRPDSGILTCDWLYPFAIVPLKRADLEPLMGIYAEEKEVTQILKQIRKASVDVTELLNSPIFIVLLVIKFRHSRSVPQNLVDFYRDLFDALLRRHNSSGAELKRKISSGLEPYELEEAFCCMSYFIHVEFGYQPLHIRDVEKIATKVAKRMSLPPKVSSSIVQDVIKITNLLLEEGGQCFFVHNTVREFYAATSIARIPKDDKQEAQAFYSSMLEKWPAWKGVLSFLEHLDSSRYLRLFAIPDVKRALPFNAERAMSLCHTFVFVANSRGEHMASIDRSNCHAATSDNYINAFFTFCNIQDLKEFFSKEQFNQICSDFWRDREVLIRREEVHATDSELASVFFASIGTKCLVWRNAILANKLKEWEEKVQADGQSNSDFEIS